MPGDTKENVIQDSKDQIAEFLTKTELKKWDSNQKKYCTVDVICLLRSICKKKHVYILKPCKETGKCCRKAYENTWLFT